MRNLDPLLFCWVGSVFKHNRSGKKGLLSGKYFRATGVAEKRGTNTQTGDVSRVGEASEGGAATGNLVIFRASFFFFWTKTEIALIAKVCYFPKVC